MSILTELDLRWLTAGCLILIGAAFIYRALQVWWMPLSQRVILFEPYLTPEGLKRMLKLWPLVFIFGSLLLVGGVSKLVFWMGWNDGDDSHTAYAVALFEAIFAVWAAGSLGIVLWKRR